jgi:hypothetical protein
LFIQTSNVPVLGIYTIDRNSGGSRNNKGRSVTKTKTKTKTNDNSNMIDLDSDDSDDSDDIFGIPPPPPMRSVNTSSKRPNKVPSDAFKFDN